MLSSLLCGLVYGFLSAVEKKYRVNPRELFETSVEERTCGECKTYFRDGYIDSDRVCNTCNWNKDWKRTNYGNPTNESKCKGNQKNKCDDYNCNKCFEKSFISSTKAKYWNYVMNGGKRPREIAKSSSGKMWFNCENCFHVFNMQLDNVAKNRWCSYCSGKKLCDVSECHSCFNKSFATSDKAKYWNYTLNALFPRQITINSSIKYWFSCNDCYHNFQTRIYSITSGNWCPYCAIPCQKLCDEKDCKICFDKSFASSNMTKYWSKKNTDTPRQLTKCSDKKRWFECGECKHCFISFPGAISNGSWCPYCAGKKLCDKGECIVCNNRSFATSEKVKYWSTKNREAPHEVTISSSKKYWFDCSMCKHSFQSQLSNITRGGWCPYCAVPSRKLCGEKECVHCFDRSFASSEKAKYWSRKNSVKPRDIMLSGGEKFWFDCGVCKHSFLSPLNGVKRGNWCPLCKNKTEGKLKLFLSSLSEFTLTYQHKFDWCRSLETKRPYPFDFLLQCGAGETMETKELKSTNIIIELDGPQHFLQVSNWQSHDITRERDLYKSKLALENSYSVIRICQEDVFSDTIDWKKTKRNYRYRSNSRTNRLFYCKKCNIVQQTPIINEICKIYISIYFVYSSSSPSVSSESRRLVFIS